MHSWLHGSRVLLAWLDTTDQTDVALTAVVEGKAFRLTSTGERLALGACADVGRMLPWLNDAPHPNEPLCAYAVIVEVLGERGPCEAEHRCIRSGFVQHPSREDVARLEGEFRAVAAELTNRTDPIEIAVLGGTASRGGRDVALSDGEFAVVTTIALSRRILSREELCDKLWPDRDMESAARLLKVYVHRIRSKFGTAGVIDTRGGGYGLGGDVVVDLHALEPLVRGLNAAASILDQAQLAMVQRAFEGVTARRYARLSALECFPELERRLLSTGVELARLLVEGAFRRNDGERALEIAHALVEVDPADDVAAELLIRTELRLGRPDAASRFFRSFCRAWRSELDLPPPPHLCRLLEA